MHTNPITTPTPSHVDDDEVVHLICCDDNTALCGIPLAGDWIDEHDAITTGRACRRCLYLQAELVPCGDRACGVT
jgi:hypothetical protein